MNKYLKETSSRIIFLEKLNLPNNIWLTGFAESVQVLIFDQIKPTSNSLFLPILQLVILNTKSPF